jgi:hypothetical protein
MSGKTQSTSVEQGAHRPATHQEPFAQSASVWQAQLAQSSVMVRVPFSQTADQTQQGRGAVEQLKLPLQGSPFVPRARASKQALSCPPEPDAMPPSPRISCSLMH